MDEFQQYWLIFRRRWLPSSIVFLAVLAFSSLTTTQEVPIYQVTGQLQFKKNRTSFITGVGSQLGSLETSVGGNPLQNEATVLRSVSFAQKTIDTLQLKEEPKLLLKNLAVLPIPGTDLLELSYKDPDPNKATKIINTLMEVYIKNDIETNRAETKAAREFIEQQLPKAEATLREAEEAMRRLQEQNRVIDLSEEASILTNSLQKIEQEIAETQTQLTIETSRSQSLQQVFGTSPQEVTIDGILGESPAAIPVLKQLQEIQLKIKTEKLRFSESHPVIANLRKQEAILKSELDQRVENSFVGDSGRLNPVQDPSQIVQPGSLQQGLIKEYVEAEAKRNSLQRQLSSLSKVANYYTQRASVIPKLAQQQRELERQQKVAQTIYENLLTKLQDLLLTENQQVGNARVLTKASVSQEPIRRPWYTRYVQGTIMGFVLAAITAWLLETIDKTVKTPESARELLKYPLLGTIPNFGDRIPSLVVRDMPSAPVSEAFRMVVANLRFLRANQQHTVIVVASAVPQEGKSTITANLATAMAQLGRRVLLIDADLRKATQHRLWELPNQEGLSSVLLGQTPLSRAVIEVIPNLEILPGGGTPPNPVALFDSGQMSALIAKCLSNYDLVIIDTPPLTLAADATIIGRMTDGIVLVVRPGVADSRSVSSAKELLDQSGQNVLGLVVNGSETPAQYYYRYGYYGKVDEDTKALTQDGRKR